MLFKHQRFSAYPIYFFHTMFFYCLCKLSFYLCVLKFCYLLSQMRLHPSMPGFRNINHVVLSLFCFPLTAQHITAGSTFEVTKITKSIIPTHWLHCGVSGAVCCLPNLIVLVLEQSPKIISIHIGV